MTKVPTTICMALLFAGCCLFRADTQFATAQSAAAPSASDKEIAYGVFHIRLAKPLNSEKLKRGDIVEAQTVADFTLRGIKIPAKSKVWGEVKEATARANGAPDSRLAILFYLIELRGGGDIAMSAVFRAIGPDSSSRAVLGRNVNGAPDVTPPSIPYSAVSPDIHTTVVPVVNEETAGVVGIHGLQIDRNGVIVSDGKQVRLVPEMQLTLQAAMRITK